MKHTPEPWDANGSIISAGAFHKGQCRYGAYIGECDNSDNTSRAVACVNALAGIEDPAAFVEKAKQAIAAVKRADLTDEEIKNANPHGYWPEAYVHWTTGARHVRNLLHGEGKE